MMKAYKKTTDDNFRDCDEMRETRLHYTNRKHSYDYEFPHPEPRYDRKWIKLKLVCQKEKRGNGLYWYAHARDTTSHTQRTLTAYIGTEITKEKLDKAARTICEKTMAHRLAKIKVK